MAFANVQFPTNVNYGTQAGPSTSTSIVETESGGEVRVGKRDRSRRQFDASYSIREFKDIAQVMQFYEARRGPLEAFRYRDWFDYSSTADGQSTPTTADQLIGTGDGTNRDFQLVKRYTSGSSSIVRPITKPIAGSVVVAVGGNPMTSFSVDDTTGIVTLDSAPSNLQAVTAGYLYDVPVRFGQLADEWLSGVYDNFGSGSIPSIPLIEVLEEVQVTSDFIAGGAVDLAITSDYALSPSTALFFSLSASSTGLAAVCPDPSSLPLGRYFTVVNVGTNSFDVEGDSNTSLVTLAADQGVSVYLGEDASSTRFWYTVGA